MIIEVALTATDGQTRANHDTRRPLTLIFDQTIMGLEVSQISNRRPLLESSSPAPSLECTTERPTQGLVLNVSLTYTVIKGLKL